MSDTLSKEKRSQLMAKVRDKNTRPELLVRKWLHRNGYRFRLYRKDLPGKPDIVLPKYKTVIFIHGCFWHRHANCKKSSMPATNVAVWEKKFKENIERDKQKQCELETLGWKVIILWQCDIESGDFASELHLENSG